MENTFSVATLGRVRAERKKLEELEVRISTQRRDETIEGIHVWAARELKKLSDSLRGDGEFEMKTARRTVVAADESPVVAAGAVGGEGFVDSVFEKSEKRIAGTGLPQLSLHKPIVPQPLVCDSLLLSDDSSVSSARHVPTSTPSVPLNDGENVKSSARLFFSDSADSSSIFSHLRASSPEPFVMPPSTPAPRTSVNVLDSAFDEIENEKASKRNELAQYAKDILMSSRRPSVKEPLSIAPHLSDPEETETLPPLAMIEKRRKGGIAMDIDVALFRH